MNRSVEELFAIEKMTDQGMDIKKIVETIGVPLRTTKWSLYYLRSEDEMVSRNVGRPRGAETVVCRVFLEFLVSHLSNFA